MVWSTKEVRLAAAGFLSGFGAGMFGCFFCLVEWWAYSAPAIPDSNLGLIYPHNEHGSVVYFSAFQTTACALMFGLSPMTFFIGFNLAPKKNVMTRTTRLGWSMTFDVDGSNRLLTFCQLAGAGFAIVAVATFGGTLLSWMVARGVVVRFG